MPYDDTTIIWRSKKLCFWKNFEEKLNQLNFAKWTDLENTYVRSHIRWLYVEVIVNITNGTKSKTDDMIKL